ncbi:MAG: ParB/RepB/Spo0J family partition protein [Chloroflexota bacterium]|nr:ParB/RepB/Spo0J family partition protein [Chloroflexota bacterium]
MEIKDIKLSEIRISELNTRKDLESGTEDSSLSDLANSIKEKGLLNPITVKRNESDTYDLIVGQRRFLACQNLGWQSIPAIIRDIADDTDGTIISLIENVHRADMNPIDKARAYEKIYEEYKDYSKIANETGVSVATIKRYLKILDLAPSIQERLSTADGPAGIATLSKIAETFPVEQQEEVLNKIGGFKQQIQLEMIKRSGGNLSELEVLKGQALEGALDVRLCRGLEKCTFIPPELRGLVKSAVEKFKKDGSTQELEI